jgi:hypothetical protein
LHAAQYQSPSGIECRRGSRQYVWYPLSHPSHSSMRGASALLCTAACVAHELYLRQHARRMSSTRTHRTAACAAHQLYSRQHARRMSATRISSTLHTPREL